MLQFLAGKDTSVVVIEPGNLKRMKEGLPLRVTLPNGSAVLIAYTPDLAKFAEHAGVSKEAAHVSQGEKRIMAGPFSPDLIDAALKKCRDLPEVER